MKKIITLFFLLSLGIIIFAQPRSYPTIIHNIATVKSNGAVVNIRPEFQLPTAHFFDKYQPYFGLGVGDKMSPIQISENRSGKTHTRYQQYYLSVPVDGAQLILHEKENLVYRVTGTIVSGLALPISFSISEAEALEIAFSNSKSTQFAWQIPDLEADLQLIKQDSLATYFPTPELLLYDPNHTFLAKNYKLVYKIEFSVILPTVSTELFYIDAQNGDIIYHTVKKNAVNVEVQAVTRYNGEQTITVDSLAANSYMFRSTSRGAGNGILTKSLNNEGDLLNVPVENATDIYEADNYFDSDVIANSAHYGAEMTYDYYYQIHGRNSYNDQGTQLLSYVHVGRNMQNAFWNGTAMFYGDGVNNYPFTFLTVCGHEITHGVTEYSADLVYQDEPGALNEAFSDIFGVMVNYYATGQLQWTIGEELTSPFRDMSNPKRFENPDTYMGTYWVTGNEDYGGVHTNCGVGNYWFYLLTEGGTGINDFEKNYDVTGISPEKSQFIAYSLLTEYLTPYSDYQEAYIYSLEVAEDLYGECSPELYSVAAAWAAVGIGYPYSDTVVHVTSVLSPVTACALQDNEEIVLELLYASCNDTLRSGTQLFFKVDINQLIEIRDTVTLTHDVPPGYFTLTLNKHFDFSAPGDYQLDIFAGVSNDNFSSAYKEYRFTNRIYQNNDFGVAEILSPTSSCHLDENTPVQVKIFFDVCDQTTPGDSVVVSFTINGANKITEIINLPTAMTNLDTLIYTFQQGGNFTLANKNEIRAFTENSEDINSANNSASKTVYRPKSLHLVSAVTFDQSTDNNYYYIDTNKYSNAYAYTLSDYSGGRVLKMTAKGDPMEYMFDIEFPEEGDLWDYNKNMDSEANFCVDATEYQELALAFQLKQTSGKDTYAMLLSGSIPADFDLRYSSMMRVLVDSVQVSETFIPNLSTNDPFSQKIIDLTPYAGNVFMLTFQAKCLAPNMTIFFQNYTLDNVYIDDIALWNSVGISCPSTAASMEGTLYPNPNNGHFFVHLKSEQIGEGIITIRDIAGRVVYQQAHHLNGEEQLITINAGALQSGIYLLELRSNNAKMVKKMIVQ